MQQSTALDLSTLPTPPGPRGLPVVGSLFALGKQPHVSLSEYAGTYGDVYQIRFGSVPTVIISHPDLVNEAFKQIEFSDRWMSGVMSALSGGGQDMVLADYGEHWRQLRRVSNHDLFNLKRLHQIRVDHMEAVVNEMIETVGAHADKGEPIAPAQLMPASNAKLMFRTVFGNPPDEHGEFARQREALLDFYEWAFQNSAATNPSDYLPWLSRLSNSAVAEAERRAADRDHFIDALLEDIRASSDLHADNPGCLAEVLVLQERAGELTAQSVRLLISDLFAAGIDTTAQTISWLLLLLANRPTIQADVAKAIRAHTGERNVEWNDREQLPFVWSAILESMRFRTVGPLAVPHKAASDCAVGGYRIAAGSQVLGNVHGIHHDARFWDEPDTFIPTRFLDRDDAARSRHGHKAFMPFSVGRRQCPGQNMAEISIWLHAARLLQHFSFTPAGGTPLSEEEVFGLTLAPHPYELRVARR